MIFSLFGISGIVVGKHNVKDPRLDQADKLVEAKKKVYVQVDTVGEEGALEADVILVSKETRSDPIIKDLEFIETRLSRNPPETEAVVLKKIQAVL